MRQKKSLLYISFLSLLCCIPTSFAKEFKTKHHNVLASDGPDAGLDSYALIREQYGKKALESPDLYKTNHTETKHIIEANDTIVGNHFVFFAHRDHDTDRDKGKTDRQRNEIKVYDKSSPTLMGFKGETLQYRWKFKFDDGFEFSKNFTHFFQIKAKNVSKKRKKNGSDSSPILTLSAADLSSGRTEFQLRHNAGFDKNGDRTKTSKLVRGDISRINGRWLEIFAQITYSEKGSLIFKINDLESGEIIADYQEDGLDLWRGEGKKDFARPKWGIYRSLKNQESLRANEEIARFADLSISKGKLK